MSNLSVNKCSANCHRCNLPNVSQLHVYRDTAGAETAVVRRMEQPDGGKKFSICSISFRDGTPTCDLRAPDHLPLYNADLVVNRPDARLVIVEGEKCADAMSCFEDVVPVTWPCGANSIGKVDFSLLSGREVYLCPDNDKVGHRAMEKVEIELAKVGATLIGTIDISDMAIDVTGENRPKFDIADAISTGLPFRTFGDVYERYGMPAGTGIFSSSSALAVVGPVTGTPAVRSNKVLETIRERYGIRPELGGRYTYTEKGLWLIGGDKPDLFVSTPIVVVGRSRLGPDGEHWGYLLGVQTPSGEWREIDIPAELTANTGVELRALLQKAGVTISQDRDARRGLNEFISFTAPDKIIRIVAKCGWHETVFVMRDRMIAATEEVTLRPSRSIAENLSETMYRTGGDPEGWKHVAVLIGKTSRGIFAMSAGLAGPLLRPLGLAGGGFHLHADSSMGKTTTLIACGSLWGGGKDGNIRSWGLSLSGSEAVAAMHDDSLLCLDDIAQAQREDLTKIAYMMANGFGKQRANIDGSARPVATWRTIVLSTGETSFEDAAANGQKGGSAGSSVRMIDVPFDASEEGETLGTTEEARRHIDRLRDIAMRNYGFAGPAFVRALVDEPALLDVARECIEHFLDTLGIEEANGQIKRVARLFGICAAAGEISISKGILPWQEGAALEAARVCFRAWLRKRGSDRPMEQIKGLRQVVDYFETYGEANFELLVPKDPTKDPTHDPDETWTRPGIVRERCGYRSRGAEPTYYVNIEAWKRICDGHDAQAIARMLRDQKALVHDENRLQYNLRLPGASGTKRVYAVQPHKIVIDED